MKTDEDRAEKSTSDQCSSMLCFHDYNHESSDTWTVPEIHTSRFGCSAGRDALSRHYRQGRRVHWSGFSSASSNMSVALKFAGFNGVLLRLTLLKAGSRSRDIHDLSAVKSEREVLSLSRFEVQFTGPSNRVN
jgi:hypothetical protein